MKVVQGVKFFVRILPPNVTSIIQPLDQGVISSFKFQYRKLFLEHIVDVLERKKDYEDKDLSIGQAVKLVEIAWGKVTLDCMVKCWRKSKLIQLGLPSFASDVQEYGEILPLQENQLNEITLLFQTLKIDASVVEWIEIDTGLPIYDSDEVQESETQTSETKTGNRMEIEFLLTDQNQQNVKIACEQAQILLKSIEMLNEPTLHDALQEFINKNQ